MDDMKKMKSSHVKVVDNIQEQYKTLEDDIQVYRCTVFAFTLVWSACPSDNLTICLSVCLSV